MADTTIWLNGDTPSQTNRYIRLKRLSDGYCWNGTAWAAFTSAASWSSFAPAMTESPSGSGDYAFTMPAGSTAGKYAWTIYAKSGGSAASTDAVLADGEDGWDGTTFGAAASLADASSVWANGSRTLSAFALGVTASTVTNPVQVDLTQTVPVRSQDGVTAPNLGDALLGAWTEPFANESVDPATKAYVKKKPDQSGPVRSYTMTTDINGNVTAR